MIYQDFLSWVSKNLYLLPVFLVTVLAAFLLLRLQMALRERYAAMLESLLGSNPALCAERLENNRRLRLVFRRPVLELWKLDAYMRLGKDDEIERTVAVLEKMKLQPRDRLEFYKKSLSYYALTGKNERALEARDNLRSLIYSLKAQNAEQYAQMLEESDIIIGVYVEHNTALIKKLIGKAEHTKNDLMRGIIQYRIAKLAWFKNDTGLCETYLARAEKNLKNTAYMQIIEEAKTNPAILAEK